MNILSQKKMTDTLEDQSAMSIWDIDGIDIRLSIYDKLIHSYLNTFAF
jgi:hypothetical protein